MIGGAAPRPPHERAFSASGVLLVPYEIFLNVHALVGSGYSQRNDGAEAGPSTSKSDQGVGSQGPGTELDADDSGIWLILQSHHVAGARADRPGAVPVAGRGWPRGPAEQLRHVDEGDFPAGKDAARGGAGAGEDDLPAG